MRSSDCRTFHARSWLTIPSAPDRYPKGRDLRLGEPQANRAGCRKQRRSLSGGSFYSFELRASSFEQNRGLKAIFELFCHSQLATQNSLLAAHYLANGCKRMTLVPQKNAGQRQRLAPVFCLYRTKFVAHCKRLTNLEKKICPLKFQSFLPLSPI